MTTYKHSEGPWEKVNEGGYHIIKNRDIQICSQPKEFRGKPSEMIANANLIVAAPELLKAVTALMAWHEGEDKGPDYGTLNRDTHPMGEEIWREWWNRQEQLCSDSFEFSKTAYFKAHGYTPGNPA